MTSITIESSPSRLANDIGGDMHGAVHQSTKRALQCRDLGKYSSLTLLFAVVAFA